MAMIRIAKLTDYAIVLLTYFANEPPGEVHNARDLVEQAHLPLPTVSKILKMLSRGELLVSHRGVKGGYSLARLPEDVSIAQIIDAIEGPIAMTECSATAPGLCELEPVCPVRSNWRRINRAVRDALEKLTLAEMTHPLPQRYPIAARRRRPSLTVVAGKST
jgi:FeS assembly SUF system regulator